MKNHLKLAAELELKLFSSAPLTKKIKKELEGRFEEKCKVCRQPCDELLYDSTCKRCLESGRCLLGCKAPRAEEAKGPRSCMKCGRAD